MLSKIFYCHFGHWPIDQARRDFRFWWVNFPIWIKFDQVMSFSSFCLTNCIFASDLRFSISIYVYDYTHRTLEPITAPRRPPLWSFNNLLPLHTPFKIRLGVPLSYNNPGSRSGKSDLVEQPGIPRCSMRPFWKALDVSEVPTKDRIDWLILSWYIHTTQLLETFLLIRLSRLFGIFWSS